MVTNHGIKGAAQHHGIVPGARPALYAKTLLHGIEFTSVLLDTHAEDSL